MKIFVENKEKIKLRKHNNNKKTRQDKTIMRDHHERREGKTREEKTVIR
jgi:hypothetical protein